MAILFAAIFCWGLSGAQKPNSYQPQGGVTEYLGVKLKPYGIIRSTSKRTSEGPLDGIVSL